MAKTVDQDEAPKKKRGGEKHMAVWLLMAMIVTGLGGWGVTNFGRNVAAIGTVGGREMPAAEYARALKQALNTFSKQIGSDVSLAQAQSLGLDRQVLQGMVLRTAMDAENDQLGLSVGDAIVVQQVKANKAFQGASGFDRETYRAALQNVGLTEKSYEAAVRGDMARQILRGAVTGGLVAPATLVDAIYAYRYEKRGLTVLELTEPGLPTPIPAPTDADLKTYYDAHIAAFTRPAGKKITYAALLPETLAPTMTIDDKAVQDLYDSRADQYHVPEKRLVERLVYPDDASATAAKAKLDAGQATFEDLVKERGLTLNDVDMGDVSQVDLGDAGATIFAMKDMGVTGPLPSALGPALYRMNGILAAQDTPLDKVKPDLVKELQLEAAKKAIAEKVQTIDDALAGGATLEDLAKEQGMTLATTDYAPGADDNDPLTADKGFAGEAAKIAVGDYPEAVVLDNGGLAALREEAEVPAAPIPLDKVKDKVTAAWHADQLHKALAAEAADVQAKVTGGASLSGFGIASVVQPVARDHTLADMPAEVLAAAFALAPAGLQVVDTPDWVGLVRLDSVVAAPKDGADAKVARDQITGDIRKGLGDDINDLYGQALLSQQKVVLDQAAITAVHASFR
jgi:peptidyl-prolyl cis-trans isomerase D